MEKISKEPLVSIVILNWNGIDDTIRCLESVAKLAYPKLQVIVVDNGSMDGSVKRLKKIDFDFQLIENPKNLGFAGGELSALPFCKGEFILLLNNDATIEPNAIHQALKTFATDNTIAVVGGKSYPLHDEDSESLHFYSHQRIDPVTADVHTFGVDNGTITDAANVSGACVMIRKKAIDEFGYFDKRFFAYYEETDLFARFRRGGWRIVYDPGMVIHHKDGATTKDKRYMYYYLMLKNQFLFAYKNFDKESLKLFKKTYRRNFIRSTWLYLRNRSREDAIHRARMLSTIWNMLHIVRTKQDRKRTLAINPSFSLNDFLFTNDPLPVSFIVDATVTSDLQTVTKFITLLCSLPVRPAEIVVVSNKAVKIPQHSAYIRIENIVHRKIFELSVKDYGFMTSNHDVLMFFDATAIKTTDSQALSRDICELYQVVVGNEAAAVIDNQTSHKRLGLGITRSINLKIACLKKSELVKYLVTHINIYGLSEDVLGEYINWLSANCRPIYGRKIDTPGLVYSVNTRRSYRQILLLRHPVLWHMKNVLCKLHVFKFVKKAASACRRVLYQTKQLSSHDEALTIHSESASSVVPQKLRYKDTPIIINTRDRFEPLTQMLKWFQSAGYTKIAFVDNDSIFPPLLDMFHDTGFQPIRLGRNGMHKAPWESFAVRFIAKGKPYVVSDPDIIPAPGCPKDFLKTFYTLLQTYPDVEKVGFGLRIDDIPDHYAMKQDVITWESRFWDPGIEIEKDVFSADIDTTFALYRPDTWWSLGPSLRTGGKLVARHDAWYQDLDNPTEDALFYKVRASNEVNTWNKGKLPKHHLRALEKEGLL